MMIAFRTSRRRRLPKRRTISTEKITTTLLLQQQVNERIHVMPIDPYLDSIPTGSSVVLQTPLHRPVTRSIVVRTDLETKNDQVLCDSRRYVVVVRSNAKIILFGLVRYLRPNVSVGITDDEGIFPMSLRCETAVIATTAVGDGEGGRFRKRPAAAVVGITRQQTIGTCLRGTNRSPTDGPFPQQLPWNNDPCGTIVIVQAAGREGVEGQSGGIDPGGLEEKGGAFFLTTKVFHHVCCDGAAIGMSPIWIFG